MKKFYSLFFCLLFFIYGCAVPSKNTAELKRNDDYRFKVQVMPFKAIDLAKKVSQRGHRQKVSRVTLAVDNSMSLEKQYKSSVLIERLFLTLPKDVGLQKEKQAFNDLGKYLTDFTQKTANNATLKRNIIIFTQWRQITPQAIHAAEELFNRFANELCIHIVGMGNVHDNRRLLKSNRCGMALSEDRLATGNFVANFVEKAFYTGPADSDGDGIYDHLDKCPHTKHSIPVTWSGCARNSMNSHPQYLITRSGNE